MLVTKNLALVTGREQISVCRNNTGEALNL